MTRLLCLSLAEVDAGLDLLGGTFHVGSSLEQAATIVVLDIELT